MSEVAKDLGEVVDVLWLSGTGMYIIFFFKQKLIVNSKFTDSISAECSPLCDFISTSIPALANSNFQVIEKTGPCFRQSSQRRR